MFVCVCVCVCMCVWMGCKTPPNIMIMTYFVSLTYLLREWFAKGLIE